MHLVLFTHPNFKLSQSMPRYAKMIKDGMIARSHTVELWTARGYFSGLISNGTVKKWLGYVDQFLVFPIILKWKLKKYPSNTLFVFTDHALGPWIPLISGRPHIVHCHDFMAQRSAIGELPENKIKLTGRLYQKIIRSGYRKAENFISISHNTRSDLHRFLNSKPKFSEVIYNGLNQDFKPKDSAIARKLLGDNFNYNLEEGYILHVGGNQFYKNRIGTIKIYSAWREISNKKLPLLMVGAPPTEKLLQLRANSSFKNDIYFLNNISDYELQTAYQGASVLIFPSLDEGFGWPIAEAMASGCPVITTNKTPMTEVGADSCFYIPRQFIKSTEDKSWEEVCADVLENLLSLSSKERELLVKRGLENSLRFKTSSSISQIEQAYLKVYESY
ncbi:glycosyltransferase involved in cell wall biosynthesis [Gillisia mitskevichiae]|uniref:Glycosyltransferase involved in cell wall biosynthesis n=1 Tax=Gillisia mitskevichiae TaxID=270921 RepID=A0A495PVZ1_9FLAO|nr:glycosyltransferase family 1 protein [Gillisia mitskevichiae]RKS53945.1 glycosyltransferase involved in cell wall biosynthesis [Gillisia mitskevichiae]